MSVPTRPDDDDAQTLTAMGYAQELSRSMGAFSNFAISLSIICILAGGVTSFHVGLCGVGGAAIGLGWPAACAFSLIVAATMAQVASAFPTAGGLYHWASILGGRAWGWFTAWFNLLGLVTVLAAIDVGAYQFAVDALGRPDWAGPVPQAIGVGLILISQATINHLGIRLTTRLTDFSGYWILGVSAALTLLVLATAGAWDLPRLWTFSNFSGPAGAGTWPRTENLALLFALGLLLPAYTITGFDASAHTAEETIGASRNVPRGIVRSVLVSGLAGWIMLGSLVVAAPSLDAAAAQGKGAFRTILESGISSRLSAALLAGIFVAQYLCGLATVTSASRMAFAFARDGGLPWSRRVRFVSPRFKTPPTAIWGVTVAAGLFCLHTPVYETIAAVCVILLYVSYVIPAALGFAAYGRTWTRMGPWTLGIWFRPLAALSVMGCAFLIVVGMWPPNDRAIWVVGGFTAALGLAWLLRCRKSFPGPPSADFGVAAPATGTT